MATLLDTIPSSCISITAILCISFLITTTTTTIEAAPQASLVTRLPGFNGTFPSNHYSGYVSLGAKKLYYYLVVSERNPADDPVVLWLNGGPGCSSFDGFVYEHAKTSRSAAHQDLSSSLNMYSATDSPRFSASDEALLRKFLPCNTGASDCDCNISDHPNSSDQFRMFEFKVRRCTRSCSHDLVDCPFAHPHEKARRRDPRRYHHSVIVCTVYRRGDICEFVHGVFEC